MVVLSQDLCRSLPKLQLTGTAERVSILKSRVDTRGFRRKSVPRKDIYNKYANASIIKFREKSYYVAKSSDLGSSECDESSINPDSKTFLKLRGSSSSSGTPQQQHAAPAPAPRLHRHRHLATTPCSGTCTKDSKRTRPHIGQRHPAAAPAPCSGTSTQARKRTHAVLPILEVRTPIAHAIWGKM